MCCIKSARGDASHLPQARPPLVQHFIEVQHGIGQHGPRRQIDWLDARSAFVSPMEISLLAAVEIASVFGHADPSILRSSEFGHLLRIGLASGREAEQICRSARLGVLPPSRSERSANTRAASMNCGSLSSTSACKGVLVRSRRTVQASREGASNVVICGGGEVRFQNVYMLRRWTLSCPRSGTKFIVLLPTNATAFHNPGGFTAA